MAQFRKKPIVIEAVQFDEIALVAGHLTIDDDRIFGRTTRHSLPVFAEDDTGTRALRICTPEGVMTANIGDWIICGVDGELYPCKPDIFEKTYEKVN